MTKIYLIVSTITMYVAFGIAVYENWLVLPYITALAIPYGYFHLRDTLSTGQVPVTRLSIFNVITYGSAALLFPETALMMVIHIVLSTINLQLLKQRYAHIAAFA